MAERHPCDCVTFRTLERCDPAGRVVQVTAWSRSRLAIRGSACLPSGLACTEQAPAPARRVLPVGAWERTLGQEWGTHLRRLTAARGEATSTVAGHLLRPTPTPHLTGAGRNHAHQPRPARRRERPPRRGAAGPPPHRRC